MGGKAILDYIAGLLDVAVGETTKDGMFTLDKVACLGCCGMAPVVMIDKDFYGGCTIQSVEKLLDKYRQMVVK
jgi:NADH:ubiquinone oxidoreductase subunit E